MHLNNISWFQSIKKIAKFELFQIVFKLLAFSLLNSVYILDSCVKAVRRISAETGGFPPPPPTEGGENQLTGESGTAETGMDGVSPRAESCDAACDAVEDSWPVSQGQKYALALSTEQPGWWTYALYAGESSHTGHILHECTALWEDIFHYRISCINPSISKNHSLSIQYL